MTPTDPSNARLFNKRAPKLSPKGSTDPLLNPGPDFLALLPKPLKPPTKPNSTAIPNSSK